MDNIIASAKNIVQSFAQLKADLDVNNPAMLAEFNKLEAAMLEIENAIAMKAMLDARFAHLAVAIDAGRRVGSTNVVDYLMQTFDISRAEATARLNNAKSLYGDIPERETPAPEAPPEGETAEEKARREEEERAAREEEKRRQAEDRAKQREAQENAEKVKAEKLRVIEQELRNLNEYSDPSRAKLHARAVEEANKRTVDDLRIWLRKEVTAANRRGRMPNKKKDPLAAHKKRYLSLGKPDSDGGVRISGYLPAGMAAALTAALAPGRNAGASTKLRPQDDKRTMGQRAADRLHFIMQQHMGNPDRQSRGTGSIVITGTPEDFTNITADSRFSTNTGHELNPLEILMLGCAGSDYALLVDSMQEVPLALGRSRRTANFEQKLVLAAMELVCSGCDCEIPAIHCDVHHLKSFLDGGRTDIENLTLVCRNHHTNNNDRRDGAGGLGYFDRDPRSGRVGWYPPDGSPPRYNDTVARSNAPGRRAHSPSTSVFDPPESPPAPPNDTGSHFNDPSADGSLFPPDSFVS